MLKTSQEQNPEKEAYDQSCPVSEINLEIVLKLIKTTETIE